MGHDPFPNSNLDDPDYHDHPLEAALPVPALAYIDVMNDVVAASGNRPAYGGREIHVKTLTELLNARLARAAYEALPVPALDAAWAAVESAIRLIEPIPYSVDVEQAGMQAEIAIAALRAARLGADRTEEPE